MHTILPRKRARRRHGSIYVTVLGVSTMVATLGLGAMLAGRATTRTVAATTDVADARLAAQAGIEIARKWIAADPAWRTTRPNGAWTTNLSLGGRSTVTIEGTDATDGNLANRPHDPLTLVCTGRAGLAVYKLQVTLDAVPTALPALSYAIHTAGQLHVESTGRIRCGDATVSTNAALKNDATIEGNASVSTAPTPGKVWGTTTTGASAKAMPASTVAEMYAALGTQLSTTTLDKALLSPANNPYGTTSTDGVYVIRSSNDVTIRDSRIYGTLVVICPGRTVTIDKPVLIQPARADYPSLVVVGNVQMKQSGTLGESSAGVNFNPTGTPYAGVVDSDKADVYPSEIQGLIHATGTLTVEADVTIRGAVIVESAAAADAVDVKSAMTIVYDPTLATSPPQGYTSGTKMVPKMGSFQQIVD